jgi:tRNA 2-selenouridine synthase
MGIEKIHIDRFLELTKQHPVFDVRSPGEYNHAHIPGAYSLPLFTDEERAVVGTAYKQESREAAIKHALDFFGPKMKKMVEEVEGTVNNHESLVKENRNETVFKAQNSQLTTHDSRLILLYCWRGGMRSGAVAWLMDVYGFKVYTLMGGYKKFRNYVLETFRLSFHFKILGGYTGSGKTEVLKEMKKMGERIIDLEDIAKHKGSAFGNIGMPGQPSQEMFENLLSCELRALSSNHSEVSKASHGGRGMEEAWLEDESQRIGLVNLPNDLWATMRKSPVYFLDIPFGERLSHIVQEYGELDKQKMIDAILRIRERLGGLEVKRAIEFLKQDNPIESFRILLKYYDKWYVKALHNRESLNTLLHTIKCKSVTTENAIKLAQQPLYHENL